MKKNAYNEDTYREFVSTWQVAPSLTEASKRLKLQPRKASVIAAFLRRHGVKLKRFPRGKSVNYVALNALAERSAK